MGSFFNVLSDRLSNDETILGRSHCDHCKKTLTFFDLFPVFSYLFLKGKCRYCQKKLSFWYPFTELATAALFIFSTYLLLKTGVNLTWISYLLYLTIISSLWIIALADIKYQIIPDQLQIILLVCSILNTNLSSLNWFMLRESFLAGLIVMLPILFLFLVTKGRGMGFGDVKFAFNMGALLGVTSGLIALYLGFVSGAIVGLILIALGKSKFKSKIAFGPFLVFGTYIMLFYGKNIILYVRALYGF